MSDNIAMCRCIDNIAQCIDHKLSEAAARGHEATVRQCIWAGATVDWRGGNLSEMTALHLAAIRGYTNVAMLLIEEGGWSLEARSREGATPLLIAAR